VTQQLREAMAWGTGPRFVIRDNDDKFGPRFDALAVATGITIVRTPVRAPNANAVCERFLRSVRTECLDHVIVFGVRHLQSTGATARTSTGRGHTKASASGFPMGPWCPPNRRRPPAPLRRLATLVHVGTPVLILD
jgi:transposase InsO family protein